MSEVVLDASAVLALLREEPGGDTVAGHVGRAAISAANLQEVVHELLREGATAEAARPVLDEPGLALHPHDEAAATPRRSARRPSGTGAGSATAPAWRWASPLACRRSPPTGSGGRSASTGSRSRWCGRTTGHLPKD